tara:strand:+ start:14710 stop:15105 length:396 start_codon:yes stop_codon:yes gene_type:complete
MTVTMRATTTTTTTERRVVVDARGRGRARRGGRTRARAAAATKPWGERDCRLVLEDGSVWPGRAFGATKTMVGEVVFNTSLSGCVRTRSIGGWGARGEGMMIWMGFWIVFLKKNEETNEGARARDAEERSD